MSDKPISEGDLVQIVRHCNLPQVLGLVFRVRGLYEAEPFKCRFCKGTHRGTFATSVGTFGGSLGGECTPLSWLKRIPPLEELESEKHDEEITA